MQIPLILYANGSDGIQAELVSDGMCQSMGVSRKLMLMQLNHDLLRRVHPDDEAWMTRSIEDFLRKTSDFDVIFRNRRSGEDGYRMVHAVGR